MKITIELGSRQELLDLFPDKPTAESQCCGGRKTVAVISNYRDFAAFCSKFYDAKDKKVSPLRSKLFFAGTRYIHASRSEQLAGYHIDGIVLIGPMSEFQEIVEFAQTRMYH